MKSLDGTKFNSRCIRLLSFNLHGFNQGKPVIDDLLCDLQPDILLVQEHWLTPDNLTKLNSWPDYSVISNSAMLPVVAMRADRSGVARLEASDLLLKTILVYFAKRFTTVTGC
jgi:hypothetical protein